MTRETTIELANPLMKFSAGHYTIFSSTEREGLHGHNYTVSLAITSILDHDEGLNFDYRFYEKKIIELCKEFRQTFLIPANSPHLTFEEDDEFYYTVFNGERIPFLRHDITIIPVTNITVEELSHLFIQHLIADSASLEKHQVTKLHVKVFSAPGRAGTSTWCRSS